MSESIHVSQPEPLFAALVAIDWADRQHAWCLQASGGAERESGELTQSPEAIQAWVAHLRQRFGSQPIALAVEQTRGALLFQLARYEQLHLYPIHPHTLAQYRSAWFPSGAKDDPVDAQLLLDLLTHHRDRLRRLQPDTEATRQLQFLVEARRKMVNEKTRQSNRLTAQLKLYFPQMLEWFDDVASPLTGDFLLRWPTLEHAQRESRAVLQEFFQKHNCRNQARVEQRLQQIREAHPATPEAAVREAAVATAAVLVQLLRTLAQGIADLNRRIEPIAATHPDFPIFDSLPGAGAALVPRLIAAFGTRRDRFRSAAEIQCYSGIAPVLERSGKSKWTHFRWACPKFLRQTFQEWAAHSVGFSVWAGAFYRHQRSRGKNHQAAVRALAFKWLRIAFRCWQDRQPYDEARYLQRLRQRHSPLAPALQPSEPAPEPSASVPQPPVNIQWKTCAGFSTLMDLSS